MIIDAPKEINAHENRIALTLQTALELTLYSQDVLIEKPLVNSAVFLY